MKQIILAILFLLSSSLASPQSKFNIACKDFTFNNAKSEVGNKLKTIFEIALSNSNKRFVILERDKLDVIFESIQEEKNLYKDLSIEFDKKLQAAGVDYLVLGNIDLNMGSGLYTLLVHFIKITGKDITEKLPLMISLNKNQISDDKELKKYLENEINKFLNTYFLEKNSSSDLSQMPDFLIELKKRDSIISYLQTDANIKTQTINNLSNSVVDLQKDNVLKNQEIKKLTKDVFDIKEYADVAKMNVFGLEMESSGSIIISSGLSKLMENVLERKDKNITIKLTDSSLFFANKVIQNFPRFPFGYWAKAVILSSKSDINGMTFAIKAKEILEITTSINGHHKNHDEVLEKLREAIK